MTPRALFLIELLDKLGAPLMLSAVTAGGDDAAQAKAVAGMVGASVQLGMALGQGIGVNDTAGNEDNADSLRVSLTALSAPIVAELHRGLGRVPGDDDVRKAARSLESIITLAQNFSPAAGHAARLKLLDGSRPMFDASQSQIFYLSAMLPVLTAVAEFSYGKPENQLLAEIAGKLEQRAEALRADLMGSGADDAEIRFSELMILQSLARLYAECHRAHTRAVMAEEEPVSAPSIDPVWAAFDMRLAMLETLLNIAVPDGQRTSTASLSPAPVTAPAASPPASGGSPLGMFAKKPEAPAPAVTPAAEESPAPSAPASAPPVAPGGSPMSFFKKKPAEGGTES
jgi:hypothetical protein